eukprot:jgi/Mesen1/1073/ME000123S00247
MAVGESDAGPSELVGFKNFKRQNPKSDKFDVERFHHIEFYCGDATNVYRRFLWGLGMQLIAKSDQTTGNQSYCSYVLKSNDLIFTFTAPYAAALERKDDVKPLPHFNSEKARDFFAKHGLGVRAVGVKVKDAQEAYDTSVKNGAIGVAEPMHITDKNTGGKAVVSEVQLYGDVVLRFVSLHGYDGPFLPNYEPVEVSSKQMSYGVTRLDHAVGNVPKLLDAIKYVAKFTGFHEFAEFTAEDVGTLDSGLNSMVLASNNEMVLLPMNEPTFGTKRKSQIQTYLEHNEGAGLQHLALKTADIFTTLREMRLRTPIGGFSFMPRPGAKYYKDLPERVGSSLTVEQLKECEELGILVDKDDQGVLLQIFTEPIGDRPTMFIEIIQRVGCMEKDANGLEYQKGGCGGFGKGNFAALFKSIEDYEKTLDGTVSKQ